MANATAIIEERHGVHGVTAEAAVPEAFDAQVRTAWCDHAGKDAIALYRIAGLSHGTPIDAASGYGAATPFMLDVGVSSTLHIARSWGLAASFDRRESPPAGGASDAGQTPPASGKPDAVTSVIERALRSAGLMR